MMHIPVVVVLLVMGFAWVLAVVCFEVGWQEFGKKGVNSISKGTACRICWGLLGLLSMASSPVMFLVNLPLLLAIGLSHIQLAHGKVGPDKMSPDKVAPDKDEIITVVEVLRNIGPALRDASARIKPFLK